LLTEVWFPAAPPHSGSAFIEVSRRHGDFALVGVAAQLTLGEHDTISVAHLALMGVAATPRRVQTAEALLLGEKPNEATFTAAAEQAIVDLDPDTDMHASADYRRRVASVLVLRALHTAAERARKEIVG
jgi:CO/xanthine dehydrogenase FAD-binding subunit